MSNYRAAILDGPRGPFAVVELSPDQHRQLSAGDRAALTGCVRRQHGTIPVVFVTAGASTLNALHGQDVTCDLAECLSSHRHAAVPWPVLDGPAGERPMA